MVSSSKVKKKKSCFFFLYFPHLFVPLTTSKVLSFESKKEKKLLFLFVLSSLIRTFAGENKKY